MVSSKQATMSERRALLTDREREIIAGEADVSDSYRYQTISRVRSRFDRLDADLEVFRVHGDLLTELQKIVCEGVNIAESSLPEDVVEEEPDIVGPVVGGDRTDTEAKEEVYEDLLRDRVSGVEFPGTKDPEECIEAVRAAYEYLQEHRKATMREFVQEVMPEHPCGYDVPNLEPGERYRGAWWRKVVKPGLTALPDVESPPSGGSDWTYTGDADE